MIRRILPALVALAAIAAIAVVVSGWGRNERLTETGVVVGLAAQGLTEVIGFTIRTSDGRSVDFDVGPLENQAEFPPSHLSVHRADGAPIRVTYRQTGSERVAIRLEDAVRTP